MTVEKNLRVTMNFHKKYFLPVNKSNLPKQVVPVTYTLGKGFSELPYFWKFASRFFLDRVKNLAIYFGLHESSLDFQRRENQMNIVSEK